MDDYNILFERTRNQQHQHQSRMQDYEDDDDETTSDDELYATTCNNNVEEAKLIGSDEKKCSRRRRFRSYKPRKTLKCFFIISLVCVAFLIFSQFFINRDTYRSAILPGWEHNATRFIPYYILPSQNTTLIDPVHICGNNSYPILLMVIVCSSANNFEARQVIRETWANTSEFNYPEFHRMHAKLDGKYLDINYKNYKYFIENISKNITSSSVKESSQFNFTVKVVFLVGQIPDNETQVRINEESVINNDLIQESFLDTYNNLTLKTVMMLKWVNNNCIDKVKFVMKCDDDTFVNIPNLLHVLLGGTIPVYDATLRAYDQRSVLARNSANRLRTTDNLLLGARFCQAKPVGNISSKWYAPTYMFEDKVYPNYLSGSGYVMSMDAAAKLYNATLSIPLFHLEDVYLTGICAKAAKVPTRHHQLFSYLSFKNPCEFKGMLTKHNLSASDMRRAYEFVTNTTVNCPQPNKYTKVRLVKSKAKNCN